jgi:hypothetical protein
MSSVSQPDLQVTHPLDFMNTVQIPPSQCLRMVKRSAPTNFTEHRIKKEVMLGALPPEQSAIQQAMRTT